MIKTKLGCVCAWKWEKGNKKSELFLRVFFYSRINRVIAFDAIWWLADAQNCVNVSPQKFDWKPFWKLEFLATKVFCLIDFVKFLLIVEISVFDEECKWILFMKTLVWGFPPTLILNFWIEVNRSLWLSLHSRSEAVTTFINRDIMTVLATIFRLCPFESTALEYISDELDYDFLPLWKWLAHFRWCESSSICWRALLSAEQFS